MCQIYISTSRNAKVYGNTIEVGSEGGDALIVVNMHRPPHNPGINNEIYNNNIIFRAVTKSKVGVSNENEPDAQEVFTKNSFHHNTYHLADLSGKYFLWNGTNNTFAETQTTNHEEGSTADTNLPEPNPEILQTENTIFWPELTEPPFDQSLLNTALEGPNTGPGLWYKFDETSGVIANDFSGNGKTGLLQGMDESASGISGHSGNGLNFDGIDDNVKAGPLGLFRYLSISMWVNPANIDKEFNALLHTDGWKKGTVHMMISGNGRIQFSLNGNLNIDQSSDRIFTKENLGNWKHIAVVYDAEGKLVKFYINGKLNSTKKYNKSILANLDNFQIGGWHDGGRNFSGKLDDIRIYGRLLSEKEIAEIAKPDQN
jgi:hypothetical protein